MYNLLTTEVKEKIGIISFNRPEQLNTFNTGLSAEFNGALKELDDDENVNVIVVRGEGRGFCAGIDLTEIENMTSPQEYRDWVERMHQMIITISKMKKPVIASAHKICVANGTGMVAAADLAIASEGTKFGTTAINVGLFCMGPAVPLSRSVGRKKALEMLLTGDYVDAKEAERIGLINKCVPADKLEEETMALAKKLAAKSPLALQMGKQSFYKTADLEYSKAVEFANEHFAAVCASEDGHEGVNAFFNKREAEWKYR